MVARSLSERIEILEQKVGGLQLLPERVAAVESQILQLRSEMRDEFSAIRGRFADVERRIQEGDEETRRFMRVLDEEVLTIDNFDPLETSFRKIKDGELVHETVSLRDKCNNPGKTCVRVTDSGERLGQFVTT